VAGMTDRTLDQLLDAWIELGPTAAPERVAEAARLEIRATRQTAGLRGWPPRRFPLMNNTVRLALAATVMAVAALLGYTYLIAPNVGDVTDEPTQTSAPTPAATAAQGPVPIFGTTYLDPGTYAIGDFFPVQFDLAITDEWETWGADRDIVRIWKPCGAECEGYSAILDFEMVRTTLEPCSGRLPDTTVGESVDELVSALTNLPGFDAGPVTDVSIDGVPGKAFELSFTGPADPSCDEGGDWQWLSNARVAWGDAQQYVIVLEVGSERLVVDAITYAGDRHEMDAIIDSIDFD